MTRFQTTVRGSMPRFSLLLRLLSMSAASRLLAFPRPKNRRWNAGWCLPSGSPGCIHHRRHHLDTEHRTERWFTDHHDRFLWSCFVPSCRRWIWWSCPRRQGVGLMAVTRISLALIFSSSIGLSGSFALYLPYRVRGHLRDVQFGCDLGDGPDRSLLCDSISVGKEVVVWKQM